MFAQATVIASLLLMMIDSNPCDNPKFKESMNSQCIDLLGDGEAQLRSGEKDEKTGNLETARAKYAIAYQKLKQGLALAKRPDVTAFREPVIRLYFVRLTDSSRCYRSILEKEGVAKEEVGKKLQKLTDQANEELKIRIQCFESTQE